MDPLLQYNQDQLEVKKYRRRSVFEKGMMFMFLHIPRGENKVGLGAEHAARNYGISIGSVSNYLRHVALVLHDVLK